MVKQVAADPNVVIVGQMQGAVMAPLKIKPVPVHGSVGVAIAIDQRVAVDRHGH